MRCHDVKFVISCLILLERRITEADVTTEHVQNKHWKLIVKPKSCDSSLVLTQVFHQLMSMLFFWKIEHLYE